MQQNDDDDDAEFFCVMVDRRKALSHISSRYHCQILTIANLGHAASRIWTCAEPEFKFIPVLTDLGAATQYIFKMINVYVKLLVQVADAEAEKIYPGSRQ